MKKEVIYTDKAPGPYSQAIKYGNLIFVAGQTSEDPATHKAIHDSVARQTERILSNIKTILEAAGSGMDKGLRCDVYLSSMAHKEEMNGCLLENIRSCVPFFLLDHVGLIRYSRPVL